MKKIALTLAATLFASALGMAQSKAIFVKTNNGFNRYTFNATSGLKISQDGKSLQIGNYNESIKLSDIEYMTFKAPVSETALKPGQQKDRVMEIGREISKKIDLNDHKDLVLMVDRFFYEDYVSYDIPERYWDKHEFPDQHVSASAKIGAILKGMKLMVSGNPNGPRRIKAAVTEAWKLSDYFGTYKVDTRNERWDRIGDYNGLAMQYPSADGGTYTVSLTPSGAENQWKENDFTLLWPEKITIDCKKNDQLLASVDIKIILNDAKKTVDVELYTDINKYVVKSTTSVTNSKVTDKTEVWIKGERIVDANSTLYGAALTDYDRWWDDIEDADDSEYYDSQLGQWVYVDGNIDGILGHFSTANSHVDILNGKLQAKAHVGNIEKLYRIMDQDEWIEWEDRKEEVDKVKHTVTTNYTDLKILKQKINACNNYIDVAYYYDGTNHIQGYITFDMAYDGWEYEDWGYPERYWNEEWQCWDTNWLDRETLYTYKYNEYEMVPVLTFSDHSSYAFDDEEFFNEDGTSTFVDDYEAIIDTYYEIVGRERPEDEIVYHN